MTERWNRLSKNLKKNNVNVINFPESLLDPMVREMYSGKPFKHNTVYAEFSNGNGNKSWFNLNGITNWVNQTLLILKENPTLGNALPLADPYGLEIKKSRLVKFKISPLLKINTMVNRSKKFLEILKILVNKNKRNDAMRVKNQMNALANSASNIVLTLNKNARVSAAKKAAKVRANVTLARKYLTIL
jgi:hypothetical protein